MVNRFIPLSRDVLSLGITSLEHQKLILAAIQTLRAQVIQMHGRGVQVWLTATIHAATADQHACADRWSGERERKMSQSFHQLHSSDLNFLMPPSILFSTDLLKDERCSRRDSRLCHPIFSVTFICTSVTECHVTASGSVCKDKGNVLSRRGCVSSWTLNCGVDMEYHAATMLVMDLHL